MKKKLIAALMGIMLVANSGSLAYASMPSSDELKNVSPDKVWTITFSDSVDKDSAEKNIKVLDDDGKEIDIKLHFSSSDKVVKVEAEKDYDLGKSYSLKVDSDLINEDSKKLGDDKKLTFEIADEIKEGDLLRVLKIKDIDLTGSDEGIEFENQFESDLDVEIDDDYDYYDDLEDDKYEEDDIVLASLKRDSDGDYELIDMKMVFEEDTIDDHSVYKLLELNKNDVALGFGRDIDDSEKKYYDGDDLDEDYAQRLGLSDIFAVYGDPDEGDFVRVYTDEDDKLSALVYFTDDEDDVDEDQYAQEGIVEDTTETEIELIGLVEDIDEEDDEYAIELTNRAYDDDRDRQYDVDVDEDADGYDDLEDDDIEDNDIVRVVAEKRGRSYDAKSIEILIKDRDFDENPVYCVIDNDEDEIELGFDEEVDTEPDDYDDDNVIKLTKTRNIAEIKFGVDAEIDEGDFVQVHVTSNGKVDAIALAYPLGGKLPDEDDYADRAPVSSMADIEDGSIVLIDELNDDEVDVIASSGKKYTIDVSGDAEDMIDDDDVHEGDFVEIEYDDDDDEITDFEVRIDRKQEVYKVIDIDDDEVELGFDNDPDTDTDDFGSRDKEKYDKDKHYVEFGKIREGDFVKVEVDDDEIVLLAEVDEPKDLADEEPGESSNEEMIVLVTDIDKEDGEYIVTVEDEEEKEYELTAVGDAEDDLEDDKLEKDSVIKMTWDEDDDEISDFDVLIDDDDDDDVYKVVDVNSDSLELGFDDDPDTDYDEFSSSDRDEVDMDRSAEIFGDLDEGEFVRLYLDDDEITVVKVVREPDELADESPVD